MRSEHDILTLSIALLLLAWIGYVYASPWVLGVVANMASIELRLLAWIDRLGLLKPWWSLEHALATLPSIDPLDVQAQRERVYAVKRITHQPLVWAAIVLNMLGIGFLLTRANNPLLGPLNLAQLDVFISRFYYASRPVVGRHYADRHPIKDARARYALKPWEFACKHFLLRCGDQPYRAQYGTGITLLKPSASTLAQLHYDREAAHRVFAQQLGAPLVSVTDVLQLKAEYRALIVAMLAARDTQLAEQFASSEQWLKQFASSFWDLPKLLKQRPASDLPPLRRATLDIRGVDVFLKAALNCAQSRTLLESSAYANVLLVHLQQDTPVSTAKMVWLKPVNRTLFYALNNVGRPRRLFVEGHAAVAHAQVEHAAQKPLIVPQVATSTAALELELQRHRWLPANTSKEHRV